MRTRIEILLFVMLLAGVAFAVQKGGTGIQGEIMPAVHHHYYGGMGIYENTDAQTIADTDWNLVYTAGDWTTGLLNGVTFQDGATGAITAFAEDAVDVEVRVTSNGHGLSNGEVVSIVNTADTEYQGVWEVRDATTDTFDINATWDDDDAQGTWVRGGNLTIVNAGIYKAVYHVALDPAAANNTFDVKLYAGITSGVADALDMSESRHESAGIGKFSTVAGCDIFSASAGDIVTLGIKNITGGNNVTIRYSHVSIFQL
jgi:hypothetical protein